MRLLSQLTRAIAFFGLAALLAGATDFSLRSFLLARQMKQRLVFLDQRRTACLALKWRWEADDQEHQYFGSSANSRITVGPIKGYVMDVSENEFGHAVGQCHAESVSYSDLLSQY